MNSTVRIDQNGKISQMPAENRYGRHVGNIGGMAKIFGEDQFIIRGMLELAGKEVTWDGATIIVKDKLPGSVTQAEFDSLCRITQAEAGGEDIKGRILVVNVVMNRVKSNRFPNTIKEVIFAPNQFEPTRNGAYKKAEVSDGTREAVRRALEGEDHSQGALFFRSTRGLEGSWHQTALTYLFTYGGHAFFN